MMLFAETTSQWAAPTGTATWLAVASFLIFGANQAIKFWDRINGKARAISPQPLAVEITKQLDERFADKTEFQEQREHCTERHGQLFNRIDKVERDARKALEERFDSLAVDRQRSLEKLESQFTFIRENLAAINRELQIRFDK